MVAKMNMQKAPLKTGAASPTGQPDKHSVKKIVTPASDAKAKGGIADLGGTIGNTLPS